MSIFDWIGPVSRKRSLWDFGTVTTERKLTGTIYDHGAALTVRTLIHGPGATEMLAAGRGNDANSAVFACLNAIATAIAEPELKAYSTASGEKVAIEDAPVVALLRRPNPYMTLDMLLAYVSHCLHLDGNAYWRKIRAGNPETGNVVELWPITPRRIEPRSDGGAFISHYRYYLRPGKFEDIPFDNIVHFRTGLSDGDHRIGDGAIKRLAREISSDEQATRYADRLLANLALPGLSVEFDKDTQSLTQDQAEEIKARIQAMYSGDNVGGVSVMSPGARLETHGFSPEQMDMKTLHRVPEERIAAVLGVPAIVAGLGAGLDRSTYSNFSEAREAFTEMKLIPFWRQLAATITLHLLPDFTSDSNVVVDFDIGDVRALSVDEDARATRLVALVAGGVLDVDEARAELGLGPKPEPAAPEPSTLPEPTPLRALPLPDAGAASTSKAREVKGPPDLVARLERLREVRGPIWITEMQEHLDRQAARVSRALRASGVDADALVPDLEAEILNQRLLPLQMAVLSDVHALVVAELAIAFQLDDPTTRAYLEASGTTIRAITETTREAVRAALIEGQAAGEGIDALARRLRDLPAFDQARAETVARTELGISQNLAALTSYRASGVVVGVRIHDGDGDSQCAAMNGRTFPLGQEPPSLQHPNCRRAFAPIVNESELSQSA